MEKVLVILPDNNKGKYISKGYAAAFKDFSYFVIERKIYDLDVADILKISPSIIFCFWCDIKNNDILEDFYQKINIKNCVLINCAELMNDIPEFLRKKSYCFSADGKGKKNKVLLGINAKDYKIKFRGYNRLITFAGNPAYESREKLLAHLIYNFGRINIFCRSYDFYKSLDEIAGAKLLKGEYLDLYKNSYCGYVENRKELAAVYSGSKINIDMEHPGKQSINYRFFEVLASGGFVISPNFSETAFNFEEGKEYESYSSAVDLVDKINFYLNNSDISQSIALRGRRNAASNHSFHDRLKKVLKVVYGKDFSDR